MADSATRRVFLGSMGAGAMALLANGAGGDDQKPIQGFEKGNADPKTAGKAWQPVSNRKIRIGIVGYGVCKFGAQFSLQDHPNVEVVAVSDLFPDRCAQLAAACRCKKTYPSLEELVKDDSIEAVFVATDAPSHCRHCIDVMNHGKHVATAVPAVWARLDDADRLYETVKRTGLNYMMFETSCFRPDLYAMRQVYRAGGFGKLIYSEGEYYHYACATIDSYKGWRIGLPPQWYPTHSNAYYVGVSGGHFEDVSCMGMRSIRKELQPQNNAYGNGFGTEIALLRTSEGGMARMGVSWDSQGYGGEIGRVRGELGSMTGTSYQGSIKSLPDLSRPALPLNVGAGGHGGSHGYLGNEFVMSILERRKPLVNVAWALNMTVAGIVAHQSAQKDGLLMKIPHYSF